MNKIYEAPIAEVINFTAMEQIAASTPDVNLKDLEGSLGLTSKDF